MSQGGWRIARASAVGTSHLSTGQPCQDRSRQSLIETADGLVLACAVADGAGSASRSDLGANWTVRMVLRFVEEHFAQGGAIHQISREMCVAWVDRIANVIESKVAKTGQAVRDYACTLLVAVVGYEKAVFFQVGDGAIVVSSGPEDGWSWMFWPQHGQYANTTNFIVSPDIAGLLDYDFVDRPVREVAIFTDGIENMVLHQESQTAHGPFFDQMFSAVRRSSVEGEDAQLSAKLEDYLGSDAVCERTDDDKTLLLASRYEPEPVQG